jgi:small-conductance mechanosensitive channel
MVVAHSNDPRERFIAQFEWDGADAIYRANRTGAAYRVTVDEYYRFLDDYYRRRKLVFASLMAGWLVVLGAAIFVPPFTAVFSQWSAKGIMPSFGVGFAMALSWLADRWLLFAPVRAMHARTPDAAALWGDDRLARTLGERSWEALFREIVLLGLVLLLLVAALSFFGANWVGWLLVVVNIGTIALTMVQMLRKTGFERRQGITAQAGGIAS